jgi:hypothetical protein
MGETIKGRCENNTRIYCSTGFEDGRVVQTDCGKTNAECIIDNDGYARCQKVEDDGTDYCTCKPNGHVCNDNNVCTTKDQCISGSCVGQAVDCDDGNTCTIDRCDTTSGCYHVDYFRPNQCNDNNVCTKDICLPDGGCEYESIQCDDQELCTEDSCDPLSGGCIHTPISDCHMIY